jgi:spore germination cell wall hydrolase CwlJ-like protein
MAEAAAPFVWGAGGAQMTPQDVTAQQKIALAMMQQGLDYSPVQSWTQGAARVAQAMLGGYMSKEADDEAKAIRTRDRDALLGVLGGTTAAPATAATPVAPAAPSPPVVVPRATPTILGSGGQPIAADADGAYTDPNATMLPAGGIDPKHRDMLIRTVFGEAANQPTEGQAAVAAVIKNRMAAGRYGGTDVPSVVRAPNQFEPWNNPDAKAGMLALNPSDPRYQKIGNIVDQVMTGQMADPTSGATHFFAPKAQAALGRSVPAWAQGDGQRIGDHAFYAPEGRVQPASYVDKFTKKPVVAAAPEDPAALPPNAAPAEGFAIPGQPAPVPAVPPGVAAVAAAMKPATPGGIPDNQKQDIRRLLATTPGSPAYQLGTQLLGKAVSKEREEITPMSPDERVKWQVPSGMSAGIDRSTGKPVFSPASTNVAVTSVADPIAAGVGKQFDEGLKNARTASREVIPIIHDARAALDGGAFTGSASDVQLALQKVGSVFGMDNKTAANTETFRATIGRQVLAHAKTLGANPSNADRDFIREVEGGSGKMEEATLRRLLDLSEKYARTSIRNHNADAERLLRVQPDAYKGVAPLLSVDEPGEYQKPAQPAVAPAVSSAPGRIRKFNPATGKIE